MEKIAIKSHIDHSDSGIDKMLILIDRHFVIILECNKNDQVMRQHQSVAQCVRSSNLLPKKESIALKC